MHFLAVTFYGLVIWLSVLAWACIAGAPDFIVAPLAASGTALLLLAGSYAVRWLWLNRATLRLRCCH